MTPKESPEQHAFKVATDTMESLVNQDERPFTAEERAELNEALRYLRKHMAQLALMSNLTLGAATLAGFFMGILFSRFPL